MNLSLNTLVYVAALCMLPACTTVPSSSDRYRTAAMLADSYDWQPKQLATTLFDFESFQPRYMKDSTLLIVYIEGDGLSWLNKTTISNDPTPINPTGLKLALNNLKGNAVYLARPCQYTGGIIARNCNKHYWTDSRFSEEVIRSTNDAIDMIKVKFSAEKLQLVGYSGGGAVAALIAARRGDVVKLITVAGNLDHQAWTRHHHISPLLHSLNPADYRQSLSEIEQIHFVGSEDKVIPPFLAQQFVTQLPKGKAKVVVVPQQKHGCCWEEEWTKLQNRLTVP